MNTISEYFNKKRIYTYLLFICLNILQVFPLICYISLFVSILMFYYFLLKKDYRDLAILIFMFGTYSPGVNIYSYKVLYLLLISIPFVFVALGDMGSLKRIVIRKQDIFILTYIFAFLVYSLVLNGIVENKISHFSSDLILLIGIGIGYLLFFNFKVDDFYYVALNSLLISQISNIFFIITQYGRSATPDFLGRYNYMSVNSEASSVFLLTMFYFILFYKPKNEMKFNKLIKCLLFFSFIFSVLKNQSIGSLTLIEIFLLFLIYFLHKLVSLFKNKGFAYIFILFVLILAFSNMKGLFSNGSKEQNMENGILFKVQNITKTISNLDFSNTDNIYYIPLSPRVRIIEMVNILSYHAGYLFFGHGLSGSYTDRVIRFEPPGRAGLQLGDADFSREERRSRIFYTCHNLNYPLLKYGFLYFIYIIVVFYKNRKKTLSNDAYKDITFSYCFLLTLTCFVGWTFQSSLVAGCLVAVEMQLNREGTER